MDGSLHVLVCGPGRSGSSRPVTRARPSGPPISPVSPCAAWPAAGPATTRPARWPSCRPPARDSSRRCSARPSATWATGRSSSSRPARLHTIPWTLLPALRDRVVSVAPSARAWMRAHAAPAARPPPRHARPRARPGLATAPRCPWSRRCTTTSRCWTASAATADKVLSALDGAWLAHIAAHGIFRADSPLFSSLRMHDGPLTVYDFEQLRRAPYRLVLSSCDSGVLAPAGADELLGLVSSLLPLGTAGIIAGVVPLNDQAVVPLMVDLHQLPAGRPDPGRVGAASVRRGLRRRSRPAGHRGLPHRAGRRLTRDSRPQAHSVIHPVSTSAPSAVRQRSRNGPAGMGSTEKQPISSTGELVSRRPWSAPRASRPAAG